MPIKKIQSRRFNLTLDWNILRVVGIYMCVYTYIYIYILTNKILKLRVLPMIVFNDVKNIL